MDLIPPSLIVARYLPKTQIAIEVMKAKQAAAVSALEEYIEEHTGEDGLLADALNDSGNITAGSVKARLKALTPDLMTLQETQDDDGERNALTHCLSLLDAKSKADKAVKDAQLALDTEVLAHYVTLTEDEIKEIVVEDKWVASVQSAITSEVQRLTQILTARVQELEERYADSLPVLEYAMARNSTSSKYHFCAGDVLFGRLRPYLRKFWHADRDGICTTEIWPLMVNRNQIDSGFLYGIVQSDPFIAAASISYGTRMPRADWNVMRNFEISLPEIQEQRAIAAVLSDMDAEIVALEERRDKTHAIKQGMMQQLLTGRVRLSESRICTDDAN